MPDKSRKGEPLKKSDLPRVRVEVKKPKPLPRVRISVGPAVKPKPLPRVRISLRKIAPKVKTTTNFQIKSKRASPRREMRNR